MNRILAFFLLLLVGAAALPCCTDDCNGETNSSVQHPKKNTREACSPFSACCSIACFEVTFRNVQVSAPKTPSVVYYEVITDSYFVSFYDSFWQPPRG